MNADIIHGDCIEVMRTMPDNSVDAIVTDPPYGLGFMGKKWDELPPGKEWADECLRVLKPGGHLLAFGGTRTWHRLAVAVEDAGFEIRDSIAWMYGSGFPKSLDVSKAIDKSAGVAREIVGKKDRYRDGIERTNLGATGGEFLGLANGVDAITAPATEAAQQWQGWGTALKPAFEPVVVARKPFPGTVAGNVQTWGAGAINIDSCRIGTAEELRRPFGTPSSHVGQLQNLPKGELNTGSNLGRWPANVILDEAAADSLDQQSEPFMHSAGRARPDVGQYNNGGMFGLGGGKTPRLGDSGGASRFFYVAKAPKKERPVVDGVAHPTVKPLALMRWLVRLVTPAGGVVLDPFAGSGTTVEAALLEGFQVIGIEREAEYLPLIQARVKRSAA